MSLWLVGDTGGPLTFTNTATAGQVAVATGANTVNWAAAPSSGGTATLVTNSTTSSTAGALLLLSQQ